ncbi:MAG: hypothetical protein WAM97_00340 [Acidimicrobiales bacterium]|jgi:hypothetical protein
MRPYVVITDPEIAGRTTTEEGSGSMSQPTSPAEGPGHKTLVIRLELPLHAQLSVIAQLRGSTITEEIRQALQAHVESVRSDTGLTAKADAVREDIEREAQERREAIASLFGEPPVAPTPAEPPKATPRRSRSSEG